MQVGNIQIVALVTLVAAILTILEYFKYLPNVATIVNNPRSILGFSREIIDTYHFKKFWKPIIKGSRVVMVLPPEDIDDRRHTQVLDHQGAKELLTKLNRNFRNQEFEFIPSDSFNEAAHRDCNVLSISGPIPNSVTHDLLYNEDRQKVPYKFETLRTGKVINTITLEGTDLSVSPDTYYDEGNEVERIKRDFGIITRSKSPYNGDRTIISVSGGFGEGTLAGIRILTDPEKVRYLEEKGGEHFQALYTVSVGEEGQVMEPTFISEYDDRFSGSVVRLNEPGQSILNGKR